MIIISEDKQVIVNFDNCVDAFIHPIKTKILCGSIANGPQKEIGVYDSREKVNRAFGFLIRANLAYLNKKGLIFKDKEVTKACVGISKLAVKVSNLKKDKKVKK